MRPPETKRTLSLEVPPLFCLEILFIFPWRKGPFPVQTYSTHPASSGFGLISCLLKVPKGKAWISSKVLSKRHSFEPSFWNHSFACVFGGLAVMTIGKN